MTLGASDTFDMSSGEVTGAITGARAAISLNSVGISAMRRSTISRPEQGSNDDTLDLALGGFGSYAAFSSSMAQVGSDVVIRPGVTDSITLNDVRLSSLASADFKVGVGR